MIDIAYICISHRSICRILRGLEAPGGPDSNVVKRPGGPPKQNKHFGSSEVRMSSPGVSGGWK